MSLLTYDCAFQKDLSWYKDVLSCNLQITPGARVVAAEHVPDISSICIAYDNGDILVYELESKMVDVVGTIETGITAMKWSPDFEIVAFTTEASTLLLMTLDFDAIIETPLIPEDELAKRTASHVSAYNTAPIPKPSLGTVDVKVHPKISWRGDGNYFAVSTVEDGVSCFRVWERTGSFHSKSEENVMGQGNFVAWRPSGEIIASYQEQNDVKQIIFFERNGLRHYEFPLRNTSMALKDLQWNAEGDVLAVLLEGESEQRLQLWSTKNYHWYLKQEFCYTKETHCVVNMSWNIESSMTLYVYFTDGKVAHYFFHWDVDESFSMKRETEPSYNEAVVAVIDGARLLLTPFKRMTIPPPLSATSIDITSVVENAGNIQSVSFDPIDNKIVIITSTGYLMIFHAYKPIINVGKPNIFNQAPTCIAYVQDPMFKSCRHIQSFENVELFVIQAVEDGTDHFVHYRYDLEGTTIVLNVEFEETYPRQRHVLRTTLNPNVMNYFLEYDDGSIALYDLYNLELVSQPLLKLPAPCYSIKATTFCDEDVIVGLSGTSKLYIRDNLVSNQCNSFHIGSDYLMFTTLTHTLRFMALHLTVHENLTILENAKTRKNDDSLREVEQGSHLITSVYGGTRVVLQMPRGNLEIIDPRALVLHLTRKLLSQTEYLDAFTLMRKHRIDLNLIYDHNPALFTDNIGKFIQQVDNIDYINLFISGLKDEDITMKDYADIWHTSEKTGSLVSAATIAKRSGLVVPDTESKKMREKLLPLKIGKDKLKSSKVNQICDLLKTIFQKDSEKYLLPILTCLVSKRPPEIAAALSLVQKLREDEINAGQEHNVSSEKALKYLTFLIDVNVLYDIALGMYDFDLVVLVAQKSQKDPREYLPFLANLQSQPGPIQRYNIDKHLKRWDRALENLSQADENSFEDCLTLIRTHNLYTEALKIFKNDEEKLRAVLGIYGDYFFERREFSEAATVYYSGKHLEKALESYKQDMNWKRCISVALELKKSSSEMSELYLDLANNLRMGHRHEDSAHVFEHYVKNPKEAIHSLLTGALYKDAVMLAYLHQLEDLIEAEIKPAAQSFKNTLLREVQEKTMKLMKYHNRLITIRANKFLQSQHEESPEIEGSENSSMYSGSDSSSVSGRTRYSQTSRSSRKSRKPSKKKLSGRKGSPFEEEYLIQELPLMLPNVKLQSEIKDLATVLFEFGFKEDAIELQDALTILMEYATKAQRILKSISPKTREELDEEAKKVKDPLLDAIVNPVPVPNVSFTVSDWQLKILNPK